MAATLWRIVGRKTARGSRPPRQARERETAIHVHAERHISAPLEHVFELVRDIEWLPGWNSYIASERPGLPRPMRPPRPPPLATAQTVLPDQGLRRDQSDLAVRTLDLHPSAASVLRGGQPGGHSVSLILGFRRETHRESGKRTVHRLGVMRVGTELAARPGRIGLDHLDTLLLELAGQVDAPKRGHRRSEQATACGRVSGASMATTRGLCASTQPTTATSLPSPLSRRRSSRRGRSSTES